MATSKALLFTLAIATVLTLASVSHISINKGADQLTPVIIDFIPHPSKAEIHIPTSEVVNEDVVSNDDEIVPPEEKIAIPEEKISQKDLIKAVKSKPFKSIAYVNRLYGYWPPSTILAGLGVGSKCYDVFILTFWMYGMLGDSVSIYANPINFIGPGVIGDTNAEIQQNLLKLYHDQGALLFISAFGAAQNPTIYDPILVAESLAKWVNENPSIDGIDIDYEDNDAIVDGTGVTWLIAFQKKLVEKLDNKDLLITHAPQAPYFSRSYYKSGGYYTVDEEVGETIAWYNIQFYNQGEDTYNTYKSLYVESGHPFYNTAYEEILNDDDIPLSKLILGKPASVGDATNTGYMTPSELASVCNEGYEKSNIAIPGFFIWQFSSDSSCSFYNTFTSQYLYASKASLADE